ncbi:OmpA family protein [Montanilutibacter psychrotolerans]|uniref:DUF11 domain-containing protein n=1 Tax=Montanilutibacter psychrotolerans TaxID=1327343 RepID=A0A3M8SX31_9GAMM|nr:OmpA family protein [Lysobacter psychrotolerans]RNF85235.1 DUF11 domain-containing protein [Lysobacter psychrotolerans]
MASREDRFVAFKRAFLVAWLASVLCLGLAYSKATQATAPAAGTTISNQALGSYVPAGYTQQETTSSNTVHASVQAVEALLLTQDQTIARTPGSTARFAHLLTNTGNIASTYTLTISPGGSGCPGTTFELSGLKVHLDLNGNGSIDRDDPAITLGAPAAISLSPGRIASLIVEGNVPTSVTSGQACFTLTATANASGRFANNVDVTTVRNAAVIWLTKSASHPGIVVPGSTQVDYTVSGSNIGNQDAAPSETTADGSTIRVDGSARSLVLIRDAIPEGTQYVAGSLRTAMPGALRLFRLPGDPAYSFRTAGDDAAAIEVAIGLPFSLVHDASVAMTFSVRVLATAPAQILNTADVDYDDGLGPTDGRSNTVVIQTTPASIGLAKDADHPMVNRSAKGLADGTVTVTFALRAKNYGGGTLYNVQVTDALEGGGTRFGVHTPQEVPGAGQYTVVAGSLRIADMQGPGTTAAVNAAFTGASSQTGLLQSGATLPAGGEITIVFAVRFATQGHPPTLYNNATAEAALFATGPSAVSDPSVNGTDPDPDGNGDPSDNTSPTPVSTTLPVLTLQKTVTPPQRTGASGELEFEYRLTVTNIGTAAAPNVRLIDNLDCTFLMDQADGAIATWQMVGRPTAQNGLLTPATSFTGSAPCNRAQHNDPNAFASMPTQIALVLTDGSRSLAPGASETMTIRVRATLKPADIGTRVQIDNRAWAASLVSNTVGGGPDAVVMAVADDVELLLIDPQGVVYNAVTRQPVRGATVRFYRESCASAAAGPITADQIYYGETSGLYTYHSDGSVSMVTPASGEYQFYFKSPPIVERCTYRVEVAPPAGSGLAAPSTLIPAEPGTFTTCSAVVPNSAAPQGNDPTTHYLRLEAGRDGANGAICEVVHNHFPLDPAGSGGLMLQKVGDKQLAELGDFVHYTLTLTTGSGNPTVGLRFVDELPLGFAYVPGSTRVDGAKAPDPEGGQGRTLTFDYPDYSLAAGASVTVQYRLRIGVGAPTSGDAINRARAYSGTVQSNEASWRVRLTGGVFSDEAFVVGKVFLDCNRNQVQDPGELGVPGARLFIEDGTGAITDSEGKWSLYGLRPITHALKLDGTTLPEGAQLELVDNRQAGRADSRFVDLRKGNLHKANFAIAGCDDAAVVEEVKRRHAELEARPNAEGEAVRARVRLTPDGQPVRVGDVRALAASGKVTDSGSPQLNLPAPRPLIETPGMRSQSGQATTSSGFQAVAPAQVRVAPMSALPEVGGPVAPSAVPLEQALAGVDNSLAFMELKDRDTLPSRQVNVRVKGSDGVELRLKVNGEEVSVRRVGKKAALSVRNLVAWEYIGIELKPGGNLLELEAVDPFGNVRDRRSVTVIAPDQFEKIDIDAPTSVRIGVPLRFGIRLADAAGVPVTARTAVTLEASSGRWITNDLNPDEPGLQAFIEGGQGEFELMPPDEPGDGFIRAAAGEVQREAKIDFLPELRPMVGIGIAEVRVDFGTRAQGLGSRDVFEAELENWSEDFADGKGRASARLALFFKGVIKGEYLLTAAYDSEKTSRDRLFRDIRPDEYYPVYGDASTRVFDAQTTDRAYVRIDKDRSFLLYGDLTTAASPEVRQLSQVNRSLTGIKHHYENDRVRVESYASRDRLKQQIEEFPANGTSGPFYLKAAGDLFANGERVEILVRDRNQPNLIMSISPLTRFADYAIEPVSKRLLFNQPVPSLDPDLNPQSIRVTYEVDGGGPAFWVAGVDAQVKVGERVQLGMAASVDEDPDNRRKLVAATGIARLGERTTVAAELVGTRTDEKGDGLGARLELRHEGERLKAQVQVAKVDGNFDNPSSAIAPGRTEANARVEYSLTKDTRLKGEVVYSDGEDDANTRRGVAVTVQHRVNQNLTAEVGVRAGRETASPAGSFDYGTVSSPSASSNHPNGASENDLLTLRGRLTARLPFAPQARVFLEAEQALDDSDRQVVAAGGDYRINDKLRVYGRYEFISSLTGPYGLNDDQHNNVGIFGIESTYSKSGRAYSEYRLRDSFDGSSAQAAFGLRNAFRIGNGLRLQLGVEHTQALGGEAGVESTAVTSAVEYTALDWLKASGGLEMRFGDDADSLLGTAGVAWKIDPDWTLLSRLAVSSTDAKRDDGTDRFLVRQQVGIAYRPVDQDMWNALARYEYKLERLNGLTDEETASHILSAHVNVQPDPRLQISGRYAAKYSVLGMDDVRSTYWAQLVSGRAIYDLGERWDVGLQTAFLYGKGGARQWSFGVEAGYRLMTNLWLSAGYNFIGLDDPDLAGEDYLDQGAYVRLRYKFDEGLFGAARARPATPPAAVPSASREPSPPPAPVTLPASPSAVLKASELAGVAHFNFDGYGREDLVPGTMDELARVAAQWREQAAPSLLLLTVGHADKFGTSDYNQRLSERRAETVRAILIELGVEQDRVRITARGADRPVSKGCTDALTPENIACLAADRRVEILIAPHAQKGASPTAGGLLP